MSLSSGVLALFDVTHRRVHQRFQLHDGRETIFGPKVVACGIGQVTHRQRHHVGVQGSLHRTQTFTNNSQFLGPLIELELQCNLVSTKPGCFAGKGGRDRTDVSELVDKFSITGAQQLDYTQVPPSCFLHQFGGALRIVTQFSL